MRAATIAVALAASVLSGCGGSTGEGAGTPTPGAAASTPPAGQGADLERFTACLRKQGIDLPQGGGPPGGAGAEGPPSGVPDPAAQQAMQACERYAPQAGPGGGPPADGSQ